VQQRAGTRTSHTQCLSNTGIQPAEFGKKRPSVYELRPPKYILRPPKPKLRLPKLIDR